MKRREKVYVKVTSDFDASGFMLPRSITWSDGRVFTIDAVKDFRPASSLRSGHIGDRYTVLIHGTEKYLFFEKPNAPFSSQIGRWFVERG